MAVQMSLFVFLLLVTAVLFWKNKLKVWTAVWIMLVMSAAPVAMSAAIQSGTGDVVAWIFETISALFAGA
jgi:hypothetical protein